ncbi:MAG: hypothetical protein AABY22_23835 [Nanoarchaeota archaeon]
MDKTGTTQTQVVKENQSIMWGYCQINPITQVIEYFYNQRKKN